MNSTSFFNQSGMGTNQQSVQMQTGPLASQDQSSSLSSSKIPIPPKNNILDSKSESQSSTLKKRTIPLHLVKRKNKSSDAFNDDDADLTSSTSVPFAINSSYLKRFGDKKLQPVAVNNSDLLNEFGDAPPKKSLKDFNFMDNGDSDTRQFPSNSSFLFAEDTDAYRNAFNRYERPRLRQQNVDSTNKINQNTLPFTFNGATQPPVASNSNPSQNNIELPFTVSQSIPLIPGTTSSPIRSIKPLTSGESAVLVFGFEDETFNTVIKHFAKFGYILEDFNIDIDYRVQSILPNSAKPAHLAKTCPIFLGKHWVKITYDNPSSAIRAIRENGIVLDDNSSSVIGVIPYTKASLEKLLHAKITPDEDIGDSIANISYTDSSKKENEKKTINNIFADFDLKSEDTDGVDSYKFKLKDGKNLLKSFKPVDKKEKKGLAGNVSRYLFGVGEL